jgi:hypothetical protein
LNPAEEYLLEVTDQTANAPFRQVTRANSYRLPAALAPTDGLTHVFQWHVTVAQKNDQGEYFYTGAPGPVYTFEWRSS